MMQRYWASLSLGSILLLLAVGLLARGAAPVAAEQPPEIATPKSALFQLEGAYTMSDTAKNERVAITVVGDGAIDTARKEARVAVDLAVKSNLGGAVEDTRLHLEVIQVDGRLYWRDPEQGHWEWSATAADNGEDFLLPSLTTGAGGLFATPGDTFVRAGAEVIDGAATTHWRADLDFAKLLGVAGLATPAASDPPGFTLAMVFDLWIGDADRYLYRTSMAMTLRGAENGQAFSSEGAYTLTYSNLDQPVTITAPEGASPASSPTAMTAQLPQSVTMAAGSLSALGVPTFSNLTAPTGATGGGGSGRLGVNPSVPSARPRSIVVGTAAPTGSSKAPTMAPTSRPPTATAVPTAPAIARANGAANSVSTQPAAVAPASGAQIPASAQVANRNSGFPLAAGLVGIGTLLALAAGLLLLGRRIGN